MSSGSGRSDPLSEFILGRPMADGPGARFLYGGASHLLSVILAHATGMSTREFVERRLFQPLGIKAGEWPKDPQGYEDGTHGLHLTAHDMANWLPLPPKRSLGSSANCPGCMGPGVRREPERGRVPGKYGLRLFLVGERRGRPSGLFCRRLRRAIHLRDP